MAIVNGSSGSVINPTYTGASASAEETPAQPSPPSYQSDFSSVGMAAALGLKAPKSPEDIEMLFAKIATETTTQQTKTDGAAEAGKMSSQSTLMKELEEAAQSTSGNALLNFFSFILSFFFGIKLDVNVGASNSQVAQDSQSNSIDKTIKGVADFSDQRVEKNLEADGLDLERSPEEGNTRNVADRANGFAFAVAVSDFALMQVLASDAPMNGGADGPQAAIDGRMRLAV